METSWVLRLLQITSVALLPMCIYGVAIGLQIQSIPLPTDMGMGDFITCVFLIAGSAFTYLIFVAQRLELNGLATNRDTWCWMSLSFLTIFLAFDEAFMVHERIASYFRFPEYVFFVCYAVVLVSLLFLVRARITRVSSVFFVGFVLLSGVAVLADTFTGVSHGGYAQVAGRQVDYENVSESLCALMLACAFAAMVTKTFQEERNGVAQ